MGIRKKRSNTVQEENAEETRTTLYDVIWKEARNYQKATKHAHCTFQNDQHGLRKKNVACGLVEKVHK